MNKLTEQDYIDSAKLLNVTPAHIKAVAEVESSGDGFDEKGNVKLMFEEHWFSKFTKGKYDSNPRISTPKWSVGNSKCSTEERARFQLASSFDRDSAIKSTSFGKFQVMGFNHLKVGFKTAEEFYQSIIKGEREQLVIFCNFLKSTGLDKCLRNNDWKGFAKGYNGACYSAYQYDVKLLKAFNKYKG